MLEIGTTSKVELEKHETTSTTGGSKKSCLQARFRAQIFSRVAKTTRPSHRAMAGASCHQRRFWPRKAKENWKLSFLEFGSSSAGSGFPIVFIMIIAFIMIIVIIFVCFIILCFVGVFLRFGCKGAKGKRQVVCRSLKGAELRGQVFRWVWKSQGAPPVCMSVRTIAVAALQSLAPGVSKTLQQWSNVHMWASQNPPAG